MDNYEDYYTQSAEMYDILSEPHWETRERYIYRVLEVYGSKKQVTG